MNKKDNDILARDLVLAAFIVMKRQYESRDAGRAGKLQMFLNIHAGTHGDVKNIVAILNNPKSTVKLSDDQKRIYQRALDIVESVADVVPGWVAQVVLPNDSLSALHEQHIPPFDIRAHGVTIKDGKMIEVEQTEPVKAKSGRKAKNPIEMATANAKKNPKECC